MNNQFAKLVINFWLLLGAGCLALSASPALAQDKIVAIVNEDVITQKDLADFANFMRLQLAAEFQGDELEKRLQAVKAGLLDRLIEDRLILQEAKKSGITIDENRVKARVDEIKRRYPSEAAFEDGLAHQGISRADIEAKIKEQFLMYYMVEFKIRERITVSPEEVTDFYEKNPQEFIFPEERELEVATLENKDLANSFAYSLKKGEKLTDLAARYPITLNKLRVGQRGEFRKEIEDEAFKLGLGEVSDVIKIEDGYYVFILDEIIPPRRLSLQEAQDKIHSFLFDRKMQEELERWLGEIKKQSYIKVMGQA